VPRLSSITDTSYFPTDEIDQVTDDSRDNSSADKDLAFLGYVTIPGSQLTTAHLLTRLIAGIHSSGFPFRLMLSDVFLTRVFGEHEAYIYKGGVEKALAIRCGASGRVINVNGMGHSERPKLDAIGNSFFSLL
jgi:hypothetical protein